MSLDPREAYRRAKLGLPITDTPVNGEPDPIADNDEIWRPLMNPRPDAPDDRDEPTPGDGPSSQTPTEAEKAHDAYMKVLEDSPRAHPMREEDRLSGGTAEVIFFKRKPEPDP